MAKLSSAGSLLESLQFPRPLFRGNIRSLAPSLKIYLYVEALQNWKHLRFGICLGVWSHSEGISDCTLQHLNLPISKKAYIMKKIFKTWKFAWHNNILTHNTNLGCEAIKNVSKSMEILKK